MPALKIVDALELRAGPIFGRHAIYECDPSINQEADVTAALFMLNDLRLILTQFATRSRSGSVRSEALDALERVGVAAIISVSANKG